MIICYYNLQFYIYIYIIHIIYICIYYVQRWFFGEHCLQIINIRDISWENNLHMFDFTVVHWIMIFNGNIIYCWPWSSNHRFQKIWLIQISIVLLS
jgi:hypothetical protein